MIRTTVSKIKHVCALAYFVPRLLRGNIRYTPGRFEKLSVNAQRRVEKSTDSSSKDDMERCQGIINRAFTPNPPYIYYAPDTNPKHKEGLLNMTTPKSTEGQCEKCQKIIKKIFGEDSSTGDKERDRIDPVCIPMSKLQATTAKENVETLAQKIEIIDETPLVEAAAKSKIEGFNVHPKVLGNRRKRQARDRISILKCSSDKHYVNGRRKGSSRKDSKFDELAKRCLDSSSGQIDERLLKEMEKLGVPPSTRRGSRRTTHDAGIVQPDIMKRPRRPVEKTELDLMTTTKKLRESERNDDLPPPFELIPAKVNSVNFSSSCEAHDSTLCVERITPYYLAERIYSQSENTQDDEGFTSSHCNSNTEKPSQELLRHNTTAAVVPDESKTMADKNIELEYLIIMQERIKPLQSSDNNAATMNDDSFQPGVIIKNSTDEEISLLKLKQMDIERSALSREKLASTNLLSEIVDPNDISPQIKQSSLVKECKEIETLRNLLQTRSEHLTNDIVKARQFKEYHTAEFPKDSTLLIDFESESQKEIEKLAIERTKPYYLKEHKNILCKETSPHTEPGILIKESTKSKPMIESDNTNTVNTSAIFKGYSPNQESVTPHELLEQISYISRETELGTIDDYQETDYSRPEKATPSQLLDSVGVVCKNDPCNPPSRKHTLLSENNIQNTINKQSDQNQVDLDPYKRNVREYGLYPEHYERINLIDHQDCTVKLFKNTLLTSSELSRRGLTEEESDDPVMAVETGRIDSTGGEEQLTDQNMFESAINRDPGQVQFTDHNVRLPANRNPVLQEIDASNAIAPETLVNPLLDKGTVAHIANENISPNISSPTIPNEHPLREQPQKPLTFSEMLKRVRERNRKELCKEFVELKIQNMQVDPAVGECGKKIPPCPPKPPVCPPPPKPPSPPKKAPCPNPCKPKCPSTCPPEPCGPKPSCPPVKKSPCDKFKKNTCSSVKVQDALTLLFYLGPQLHIPQKIVFPLIACALNLNMNLQDYTTKGMERMFTKLQDLCSNVLKASLREGDALESILAENEGFSYAKTYDPWSPIPSWPIPVKKEKRKLVCPKDGCKVIPPKLNAPCRDINPCRDLPRHNKYTVIDFILYKLGKKVYDVGDSRKFNLLDR